MSEIITAIRVIKMYCWEKPFYNIIAAARKYVLTINVFSLPNNPIDRFMEHTWIHGIKLHPVGVP